MKIKYEYVNETVEIEVDEKWAAVIQELDRQEHNNDQTETRRHASYSYGDDGEWLIEDEDPEETITEMMSTIEKMKKLFNVLNDKQRSLVRDLYAIGLTQVECAEKYGVKQAAIAQQLATIKRKIKKYF